MAGYVTKLVGHVYDGANLSAEALINGVFAEITAAGVKKITAAKDTLTYTMAIQNLSCVSGYEQERFEIGQL